jgi:hypothetical protein
MTTLADCLALRKIARIVCVDDENAPPRIKTIEDAAIKIVAAQAAKVRQLGELDARFKAVSKTLDETESEDVEDRRARVREILQQLESENQFSNSDLLLIGRALLNARKGATAKSLEQPFRDIGLSALSFGEWKSQAPDILTSASDNSRTLLLVDEVNDGEPDVDLDGVSLIADLWKNHSASVPHVDIVLVTSKCAPEEEFDEAKNVLEAVRAKLGDIPVAAQVKRAFVVSKARLAKPKLDNQLAIQLNRLQASQLRSELVKLAIDALQRAVNESVVWLEKIPLSEFQGSVFASSRHEGAAEIDTLLRLASIKQRVELDQELKKDPKLTEKISELRHFTLKMLDADYRAASQKEIRELRELEFERPGAQINSLYAPIACGDIFEFRSGEVVKTAMLLANPCDLLLRSDGKRKLSRGWLVEVQKDSRLELEKREKEKGGRAPLSYLLPTGREESDTAYLFNNSNVESIGLHVLDFCSMNKDGLAEFDPAKALEAHEFALQPQRERIVRLLNRINQSKFGLLEIWGQEFALTKIGVDTVKLEKLDASARLSYPIRRVWRLSSEFSAAALNALSQSLSRPVFGHDYLRAS